MRASGRFIALPPLVVDRRRRACGANVSECGGRCQSPPVARMEYGLPAAQTRTDVCALFRSRDAGALNDLAPAHDLRLDEALQALDRRIFERQHAEPGDLAVDLRQS